MEECQSGPFANLDRLDWVGKAHPKLLYKDEGKDASKKTETGYSTEKPEWPLPIEKLTVFSLDHARYKSTIPCNGFIIPGFLHTRKGNLVEIAFCFEQTLND